MSLTFKEVQFADVHQSLEHLFQMHWKELRQVAGPDRLDIAYETYVQMEKLGFYHMFAVTDEDKLVGYVSTILSPALHHKTKLYAETDCFYVDPLYRNSGIGFKLLSFAEGLLKDKYGVGYFRIVVNANFKQIIPLVEKLGFEECDIVYQKKLEE